MREKCGLAAARKFTRAFGGETIEVPLLKSRAQRSRNRESPSARREQGADRARGPLSRRTVYKSCASSDCKRFFGPR